MNRAIALSSVFLLIAGTYLPGQVPTPLPGTSVDRINLPTNFRDTFKQMEVFDNNQNRQIRVIWANDIAQSVDTTQPWNFPYGSMMVFESYATVNDDAGNPTLDANGRFVRGPLTTVFASRKEQGFGAEYGPIRGGEWEYVSYNPDWSYATAPANSGSCALCHLTGTASTAATYPPVNAVNDYVFRAMQAFRGGSGALPDGVMLNYSYVPRTIHVKAGTPITLYNTDDVLHSITADDQSFDSGLISQGASFTVSFDQPGQVAIHCLVHSRMRATIIVDPADVPVTATKFSHK
jgi:plastocyanin